MKAGNLSDLSKVMRNAVEETIDDFNSKQDPQRIDIILDKYMFEDMMSICKSLNDTFAEKYVKATIDLNNVKTLLRVKKQKKGRDFLLSVVIEGGFIDKDTLVTLLTDAIENIPNKLSFTNYSEVLKSGVDSYIKNGSASLLEKLIDNYIMDIMKEAKMIPFGGEPLLAYIYAKETEIKLLELLWLANSIILLGK